jgi:O-antigen/teichoic acid export membrane protein
MASGYLLLGANAVYTLASVPLALSFLSTPEFALWALTSTIAQYLSLLDLGMSGAARIIIDHKDEQDGGAYGSTIQTFLLVSVVQGLIIGALGFGLAAVLGPLLHVPAAQQIEFFWLTIGQCILLAATFLSRIAIYILTAHQRIDLVNYSQIVLLGLSLGVLYLGLAHGQGVYSTLWAQGVGWVSSVVCCAVWIVRLHLLPSRGAWGRPTRARFRELFSYGRDIFLCAVGFQLLNASQTLIVTRVLGLEIAAVWSVCTRTYVFLSQIIYRILDYSAPMLAEMIVRKETDRLCYRLRSLLTSSVSLAVLLGVIFAGANQPFVRLWTGGKIGWAPLNDILLAVWMAVVSGARCHIGLVGQSKDIGGMRYIYLVEGAFFVGVSLLVVRWGGISAMLLTAIVGTLLFSAPYGSWRTSRYFHLSWGTVAFGWFLPSLRLAACLVPVGLLVAWIARSLSPRLFLLVYIVATGLVGVPLCLRLGIEAGVRKEILSRFLGRFRRATGSQGAAVAAHAKDNESAKEGVTLQ